MTYQEFVTNYYGKPYNLEGIAKETGTPIEQLWAYLSRAQTEAAVKSGQVPEANARQMVEGNPANTWDATYGPGVWEGLQQGLGKGAVSLNDLLAGGERAASGQVREPALPPEKSRAVITPELDSTGGMGGDVTGAISSGRGRPVGGISDSRGIAPGVTGSDVARATPAGTAQDVGTGTRPNPASNMTQYYQQPGVSTSDILARLLGGETLAPGSLTLATLLGQKQPSSWVQPGVGYGDVAFGGTPSGQVTYFNEAGKQFKPGEDTRSYWLNQPARKWETGDLSGNVTTAETLPWMQVPWIKDRKFETPTGEAVNYYNAEGRVFGPGDPESYWINQANQWQSGDLTGKVKNIYGLPWR